MPGQKNIKLCNAEPQFSFSIVSRILLSLDDWAIYADFWQCNSRTLTLIIIIPAFKTVSSYFPPYHIYTNTWMSPKESGKIFSF
jgi:hypothetical protein